MTEKSQKKKKGQTLQLKDFLNDQDSSESWADSTDDFAPPSGGDGGYDAPRGGDRDYGGGRDRDYGGGRDRDYGGGRDRDYGGGRDRDYGGGRDRDYGGGGRDRDREERRPQRAVPSRPPFIAFIGNLSYNVVEADLANFFEDGGSRVVNVRIPTDNVSGRPKGFGYVEFESADSLRHALTADGHPLLGRDLKVDVADEKPERGEDRECRADQVDRWERGRHVEVRREERRDRPDRGGDRDGDRGGDRGGDRDRGGYGFRDGGRGGSSGARGGSTSGARGTGRRPQLNLKKASERKTEPDKSEDYGNKKPNPFGAARPRDENAILREKEEAWRKREEANKAEEAEKRKNAPKKSDEQKKSSEGAKAEGEKAGNDEGNAKEGDIKPTKTAKLVKQEAPAAIEQTNPFESLASE